MVEAPEVVAAVGEGAPSSRTPKREGSGYAADTRCAQPVGLIDLYPTLVELCGVSKGLKGATLDGQEQTKLFYLSGGCSLTLRGLTLVNGRADYGGVVDAEGAGDVEIIDSIVRDCHAGLVRRVELAASSSVA